jgi:glutamate transport system substrate-binding protein
MIKDGSWERAIADNTEGTSYTPNAEYNPPKPTEGEK